MSSIVVIGSLNADFVINSPRFPAPGETVSGRAFNIYAGGKGANQACAVARLGGKVSMVGQVGNDAQGDFLTQHLASAGADVSHVYRDPKVSTGVAIITINAEGQNQIVVVPGANGTFGEELLHRCRALITSAGFVLLQLEVPVSTVAAAARLARQAGARVILDPAPAQELPDDLLPCVDYLTPNETELAILTRTAPRTFTRSDAAQQARILLKQGAQKVIVKLGSQGALLVDAERELFWPALPVMAVDTTAAGDAFNAAFAFALASGKSDPEAGFFATAAAAHSVTQPGAQPSLPSRAQVEQMLK